VAITKVLQSEMLDNGGNLMPYGPVFMYDDTQTADFVLYHGPYVKI
jgi:hypothetical protein